MVMMMSSDEPRSDHDMPSPVSQRMSLEQLLSLRQPGEVKVSGEPPHAVAIGRETNTTKNEQGSENVVFVLHAGSEIDVLAKAKLQAVAADVRLQFFPLSDGIEQHIRVVQPAAVVIQFVAEALPATTDIAKQFKQNLVHMPMFALGSTRDVQPMLFALRAGVQDFLDIEAADKDWQQSWQDLLVQIKKQTKRLETQAVSPLAAIVSARSGVGSSLLAAHLAFFLQQSVKDAHLVEAGALVEGALGALLLDLGAPAGDGALYLDLVSDFDFHSALQNLRRFDTQMASTGLAQHESGLRLLSVPRKGAPWVEAPQGDVDLLVQRLREYFKYIVADLGGGSYSHVALRVAAQASRVWVVCDQSLPSIVSTTELLHQLEQHVPRSAMELIVCRHDRQLELSAQHIAEQLQLPLLMTVPERRETVLQAVNQGLLLSPQTRREPYVQAVHKLANLLLQGHEAFSAVKPGLLSSWIERIRGG